MVTWHVANWHGVAVWGSGCVWGWSAALTLARWARHRERRTEAVVRGIAAEGRQPGSRSAALGDRLGGGQP